MSGKSEDLEWDFLVCPEDKGALIYISQENILYNPRSKRKYFIQNQIPIMLIEESEVATEAEHKRLTSQNK